jgi:hypothetical protein
MLLAVIDFVKRVAEAVLLINTVGWVFARLLCPQRYRPRLARALLAEALLQAYLYRRDRRRAIGTVASEQVPIGSADLDCD